MKGVARISFHGGALLVPARTRYDHQLIFEHVESYARRHGTVRLELDRKEFTVSYLNGAERRLCAACQQPLELLTYALGGRSLCLRCARKSSG
ncbi:MAG TPA: hypothetical protein VL403_12140 [Candidatus Kryptonia bacterium]|nr:hypothetical protein [Candidatus Kryptonia bacterium]